MGTSWISRKGESLKGGEGGGGLSRKDLPTMELFSAVVINSYRNQGQRLRNWEKDIGSQHCGKMILNIITL